MVEKVTYDIRTKSRLSVNIDTPESHTSWDSKEFEDISEKEMIDRFSAEYQIFRNFLLSLSLSRLAFDSAADTVQTALNEVTKAEIEVIDARTTESIDDIHEQMLLLFIYENGLSKIFAEPATRKEVLQHIMGGPAGGSVAPTRGKKPGPLGMLMTSQDLPEERIRQLERRVNRNKEPDQPFGDNSPAGEEAPETRGRLPVAGLVKRKSRRNGNR